MKSTGTLIVVACAAVICGCAATVPNELEVARRAYTQASSGSAAQLAPAELHKARKALDLAEQSFAKDADSYQTRDLAYVAERKAQMAEIYASIGIQQENKARSDTKFQSTQGDILRETTQSLDEARTALAISEAVAEQVGLAAAERLAVEQEIRLKSEEVARLEAEQRARPAGDQSAAVQRTPLQGEGQDLSRAQTALAVSEYAGQVTTDQLAVEQKARLEAEQKAAAQSLEMQETSRQLSQARTALAVSEAVSEQAGLTAAQKAAADQKAQLEAGQKAQLEAGQKPAANSAPVQDGTQNLSRVETALAVSEYAEKVATDQLAIEQKARIEAEHKTRLEVEQKSAAQGLLMQRTTQDLSAAQKELAVSEQAGQATSRQLATEQEARLAAEQKTIVAEQKTTAAEALTTQAEAKTAAAEAALAKLTATREDERGTIITLSGGLLFRSNEATLMPGAEAQLDQVAAALVATSDRNVIVEGYTDSEGSTAYNLALSQRRADAVRNYLVHQGYPAARLQAYGIGEGSPIADNSTNAGRANNRRVEIVLERMPMP
jgi:outer membrane protein OmpA-like peptidoglycan-associated protein